MAIKYRMTKRPDNLSTSSGKGLYPRIIRNQNMDSSALAKRLSKGSPLLKGEMLGCIEQIKSQLIEELLNGNSVSIDGLGTFSLSAEANRSVDRPEEIRAASIHVKSVNFRAAPELMSRMKEARFEREE
ncbi:MAG: HU family DNA-binding protein [Parabacteroides sp.]|jgi:predicted histone-like DNA-binding protein|nr:HU family DNA-binding protein [Parabacteroides sp.]MBP9480914.1 HU family DNA-binding protein [Parabacteroides sp.]MBP9578250.1 HU family DNA-binding protein [Parabacteroides sp.]MDD2415926.1 HU family DNA-binding protein [Parabacteroides sp.]MDD3358207.1 HU family DNA-binding protein [Parabacteroides sp.]